MSDVAWCVPLSLGVQEAAPRGAVAHDKFAEGTMGREAWGGLMPKGPGRSEDALPRGRAWLVAGPHFE